MNSVDISGSVLLLLGIRRNCLLIFLKSMLSFSLAVVFLILYLPLCGPHFILLPSSHYRTTEQEIRQLHLQQEGNVREIADLQETLEWKDKKIGVCPETPSYNTVLVLATSLHFFSSLL